MYRLIIADDEATIRNGIHNAISQFGLDIRVEALAENGQQTVEMVNKYHPELLLLDINMPLLSGLDIIEKIKEIQPLCKIIIISGYDHFNYAQKALKLGVFDYLLKPVNVAVLKLSLIKAIESYETRLWELNHLNQIMDYSSEGTQNTTSSALNYIRSHYINPELSLTILAQKFNVSSSYLTRLIKQRTGLSFSDYLTQLRIGQAKKLLQSERQHMIYEVASMVGYSSQHYFSRIFKESTGLSPSDYRIKKELNFEK